MPSVLANYFQHTLHKKLLVLEHVVERSRLVAPTTKLTAFCQAQRWAGSPRLDKRSGTPRRGMHGVVAVTIFVLLMVSIKSCYHLATTLHQAAL
jgi:hypothetical protein